jgi:hypothetical protein
MRPDDRIAAHLWGMIDATEVSLPLLTGVTWERYQADRTLQMVAKRSNCYT